MRTFFTKVRVRWFGVATTIVVLTIWFVVYTGSRLERRTTGEVQWIALTVAKLASTTKARQIAGTSHLLFRLAQLPEVQHLDAAGCSQLLRGLLYQYPLYTNLGVFKPDGYAFCSARPMDGQAYGGDRSYFQRAVDSGGFAVGDYQVGRVTGEASLNFGYPVFSRDGRLKAVLFAAMSLAWLNSLVVEAGLPEGSSITLVDTVGVVLVHYPNPEKWIGRALPEDFTTRLVDLVGPRTVEAAGLDGINRFFGFAPLLRTNEGAGNLFLSVGIPTKAAMEDGLVVSNFVAFTVFGTLALGALLVGYDLWISRRLRALSTAAMNLAGQRQSAGEPNSDRNHDFTALSRTFSALSQTVHALRENEERVHLLVDAVRDYGIYFIDSSGCVASWSKGAEQVEGYLADEIIGKHISIFYTADAVAQGRPQQALQVAAKGGAFGEEGWRIRKDGSSFWADVLFTAVRDDEGNLRGFVKVVRDTTARKQNEDVLRNTQAQLRSLASRLQEVREEERRSLSQEIHDELSGALTALKVDLKLLANKVPEHEQKIDEMGELVAAALSSVRDIAAKLRPGVLDHLGLVAAIIWQAEEFQGRFEISCHTDVPDEEITIDPACATAVFRIFQEALTNVACHADAGRVEVMLKTHSDSLILVIRDDGHGITVQEASSPRSLGLLGMRERALAFGGQLHVAGNAGKGTVVELTMPLQKL